MSDLIPVCSTDRLLPGVGVAALVAGRQVAIFRLRDGSLRAIDNHDPFSGANVLSRGLVGSLQGRPVVASPVYKQHFDLETGCCLEDEGVRLAVHRVQEAGGQVLLALHQAA